jgi:hypothetical protein
MVGQLRRGQRLLIPPESVVQNRGRPPDRDQRISLALRLAIAEPPSINAAALTSSPCQAAR